MLRDAEKHVEREPGWPILASDCDWLKAQLEALYEHDERGRTTTRCAPDRSPAPRFHLSRSRHGNLWRLRADLSPRLARRLAQLAAREAPLSGPVAPWPPPERAGAIRLALEEFAPVVEQASGPVYRQGDDTATLRSIEERARDAERVDPADLGAVGEIADAFPALATEIALRTPIVVSRDAGRIASVCYRTSGAANRFAEPGVDTLPAYRRRSHAARSVAGWWMAVRAAGGVPLYATTWDNVASLGVARSLGLEVFADSCRWS
jgi:hypothetical protein